MFPENRLSSTPTASEFIKPKKTTFTDYEWGGIDLNNTTLGLYNSIWFGEYLGDTLHISNQVNQHEIVLEAGITEISFGFDFNMNYCVAYTKSDGTSHLLYYDTVDQAYKDIVIIGKNLNVSLDIAMPYLSNVNDVILSYINNNKLCFRLQRERYEVEHVLKTGVKKLHNSGLMTNYRYGWEVE